MSLHSYSETWSYEVLSFGTFIKDELCLGNVNTLMQGLAKMDFIKTELFRSLLLRGRIFSKDNSN